MNSEKSKFDEMVTAITNDIAYHQREAEAAMTTLEDMKVSPEDYRKAMLRFDVCTFVAGYLNHILTFIRKSDMKAAENLMRFHAHYQREKGRVPDEEATSAAQANIAVILDGYVNRFCAA